MFVGTHLLCGWPLRGFLASDWALHERRTPELRWGVVKQPAPATAGVSIGGKFNVLNCFTPCFSPGIGLLSSA